MTSHNILRVATLQLAHNPNDIVKVAGILSRIKRWVLSMFDPSMRAQIGVIDSKYTEIKGLVRTLQDNIVAIESSIENVDLSGYEFNVAELGKTLAALNDKINSTKKAIDATGGEKTRLEHGKPNANKNITDVFKVGKTLESLGVAPDQITNTKNLEAFFNSIRGTTHEGVDLGHARNILKFFNGDEVKLNKFIDEIRAGGVDRKVLGDIVSKYTIRSVQEPMEKPKPSRAINAGVLVVRGDTDVTFEGKEYALEVQVFLDIFLLSLDNVAEEAQRGQFHIWKQLVWHLGKPRSAISPQEPPPVAPPEVAKEEAPIELEPEKTEEVPVISPKEPEEVQEEAA